MLKHISHRIAPQGEYKGEHDAIGGLMKHSFPKFSKEKGYTINSALSCGLGMRYQNEVSEVMIDYDELIRKEDRSAADKPKGRISKFVMFYCANNPTERAIAEEFCKDHPDVYDDILDVNREGEYHTESFVGHNSHYNFQSVNSKYHQDRGQCSIEAKQHPCSCPQCSLKIQRIVRGESFKILPLGTKNTGFCIRAALRVFKDGAKKFKTSLGMRRIKESAENYIKFFKTDAWKEMKEEIPAIINQFREKIHAIQRAEANYELDGIRGNE